MIFYKDERNLKSYIIIGSLISLAMLFMIGLYFVYDGRLDWMMILFVLMPCCLLIPMLIKTYHSYLWLRNKLPVLNFRPHQLIVQVSPTKQRIFNYHALESFQKQLNIVHGKRHWQNAHEEFLLIKPKNEKALEIPVLDLDGDLNTIKLASERFCPQVPWL